MLRAEDRVFAACFIGITTPLNAGDPRIDQFIGLAREVLPKVNRSHALIAPLALHFEDVDFIRRWATDEQRNKRTRWLMDAHDIAATYLLRVAADGVAAIRGGM